MAYDKHTWVKGELIDADKMNNIENGVEGAVSGIESAVNKTGDTMTGKLTVPSLNINGADVALPISMTQGGTGANNATDARALLSVYSKSEVDALITGGITPSGDYLPISGGVMTGQITLANSGFRTSNIAGYSVNGYGNFMHLDASTTSSWNICKNNGDGVFTVYFESGNTNITGTLSVNSIINGNRIIAQTDARGQGIWSYQGSWPSFYFTDTQAGTEKGRIYMTVSTRRIAFREIVGTDTVVYEDFVLPAPSITSGTKTYDIITIKPDNYTLRHCSKTISITTPVEASLDFVKFLDKNETQYGYICGKGYASGITALEFGAQRTVNNSTIYNYLRIGTQADGTAVVNVASTAQSAWRTAIGAVAKTGDTMTGKLKSTAAVQGQFEVSHGTASVEACTLYTRTDTGVSMYTGIGSAGSNHGIYSYVKSGWIVVCDSNGNVTLNGTAQNVSGTVAIANGGTGATTAAAARTNLGIGSIATRSIYYSSTTTTTPSGGNNGDIYLVKMA